MNRTKPVVRSYFSISGFPCHPDEVTRELAASPDQTSFDPGNSDRSSWELAAHTKSLAIEDHVHELIGRINTFAPKLKTARVRAMPGVELNIFVVLRVRGDSSAPHMVLRPDQTKSSRTTASIS